MTVLVRKLARQGQADRTELTRVVLLIGQLGLGGAELQLVLLAEGLRQRGIEVEVVTLSHGGPRQQDLASLGIPVWRAGFVQMAPWRWRPSLPEGYPANAAAFVRLVRYLRRFRPQVMHAFLFPAYVIAAPAARAASVPLVVAGRRSMGFFKEGRRRLLAAERVATAMTDLVVANAEAVARDVVRQEHMAASKLVVIRNGVPANAFTRPYPTVIETNFPIVLCVANLRPEKGHRYLLEAVARLKASGRTCTLLLAGDGMMRAELEAMAARTGQDVRFLGQRRDIRALLAVADVVVLPSLSEGLSNALLEAMAAGRAIVATDVGGNAEAVGEAGLLVPVGDVAALAEGMERVLADATLRRRLGSAAADRARSEFSIETMVDRHVQLYQKHLTRCAG